MARLIPRNARTFFRPWPFFLAPLMVAYALVIPDPHAFNNVGIDAAIWFGAGLVLIYSGLRPSQTSRLLAMCAAQFVFIVRALVLVFVPSDLSTARIAAGVIVWTMLFTLILFLTLASEIIDTPGRLDAQ